MSLNFSKLNTLPYLEQSNLLHYVCEYDYVFTPKHISHLHPVHLRLTEWTIWCFANKANFFLITFLRFPSELVQEKPWETNVELLSLSFLNQEGHI